jgi:proline- and glutamine-rich splicing factor
MNNGNSFNSVKNEPMKSAPKSFSNQNGNGSNSNSNNNSSNNTTSSSNSNSNEMSSRHENKEKFNLQQSLSQQSQQQSSSVSEKKFTGRCRLFVGNLPLDITEQEFKEIFSKYGEIGEVFLNAQRSFGFIKLDTRINAEHAKQDLDGFTFKGRCIRVRFASHGAAVRVKNLSPCVSNEYLEQAFSIFGTVERAVVIVDDKGRSTGEGIVEFERKPASVQCINKCTDMCFLLTSYPKPVVVEPLEQKDEEDGLPEKSIVRNNQYFIERETPAHFAAANSFEQKLSLKWRELYELEKQVIDEGKKRIDQAREMLEYEIEQALIDHKTMKLKEDLRAKQEELQRIEEMRKSEFQRRQDMENRWVSRVLLMI